MTVIDRRPHTIDLDEMLQWIDEAWEQYAASSYEDKCLVVRFRGGYVVKHGGKTVYKGTDGLSAVRAYNAITSPPEKL